jgi:hypothetical protein
MSKSGSDTKTEGINNCINLQYSCQSGKPEPQFRDPRKKHQAIACAGAKSRSKERREEIAVIGNCMLVRIILYLYTVYCEFTQHSHEDRHHCAVGHVLISVRYLVHNYQHKSQKWRQHSICTQVLKN